MNNSATAGDTSATASGNSGQNTGARPKTTNAITTTAVADASGTTRAPSTLQSSVGSGSSAERRNTSTHTHQMHQGTTTACLPSDIFAHSSRVLPPGPLQHIPQRQEHPSNYDNNRAGAAKRSFDEYRHEQEVDQDRQHRFPAQESKRQREIIPQARYPPVDAQSNRFHEYDPEPEDRALNFSHNRGFDVRRDDLQAPVRNKDRASMSCRQAARLEGDYRQAEPTDDIEPEPEKPKKRKTKKAKRSKKSKKRRHESSSDSSDSSSDDNSKPLGGSRALDAHKYGSHRARHHPAWCFDSEEVMARTRYRRERDLQVKNLYTFFQINFMDK